MARLLFVTSRLPWPPHEGHQLRSWHLLRAASREHQVVLLSLQRPQDEAPEPVLRQRVAALETVRLRPLHDPRTLVRVAAAGVGGAPLLGARYVCGRLRRRFRRLVREADLVHLDILAVAGLIAEVPAPTPVVLNQHNVESLLLRARAGIEAAGWKRRVLQWQAGVLQRFEVDACSSAARVLACSEPDAKRLQELAPASAVAVIPNGVDLARFVPAAQPEGARLVFVGQMGWFPNRDGIEWFLADVLPRIRASHDASLVVIGHACGMQPPPGLEARVEFTGFVDDLRPRVQDAGVYVVPLRAGSGTRLKLLEAMAMGKAIVSTRIGAEGIGLVDGENALLADGAQAFAAAVVRLLDDPALRARLGAAARRAVEREYGWEAIGDRLLAVYDDVLAAPRAFQR